MNREERRRRQVRRVADRYREGPIDIVDLGDGYVELVIGGVSTCGCARCAMLLAYQALKDDGPPIARATHLFERSRDEVRDDHQAS